jgi:hypothetical protein
MIVEFLVQFLIEFTRALLIDGLSQHVRRRVATARRIRRDRRLTRHHSIKALRRMRKLSTADRKNVS